MHRLAWVALALSMAGCPAKNRGDEGGARVEQPNRDPYRNVTPQKVKQQVEETQKKEDERNDRVLEQAK